MLVSVMRVICNPSDQSISIKLGFKKVSKYVFGFRQWSHEGLSGPLGGALGTLFSSLRFCSCCVESHSASFLSGICTFRYSSFCFRFVKVACCRRYFYLLYCSFQATEDPSDVPEHENTKNPAPKKDVSVDLWPFFGFCVVINFHAVKLLYLLDSQHYFHGKKLCKRQRILRFRCSPDNFFVTESRLCRCSDRVRPRTMFSFVAFILFFSKPEVPPGLLSFF